MVHQQGKTAWYLYALALALAVAVAVALPPALALPPAAPLRPPLRPPIPLTLPLIRTGGPVPESKQLRDPHQIGLIPINRAYIDRVSVAGRW